MAIKQRSPGQLIWGILLVAMGVLLCVKKPYALQISPESAFLSFARYFIAALLIVAGAKKLYGLYSAKDEEPPSDG